MKKIYTSLKTLCLVFSLLLWLPGHAQDKTITGKVTSADDSLGLPGVNVVEKGTTNGVVTDFEGEYSITVSGDNATLVFTYVGFAMQEVPVNGKSQIDIAMAEDATALDEVVLVGYGTQIKRQVTGAVQTIDAEELADIPVSQITQKLQGKLAGVQINQTTGKPGQGVSVRIRGQLSVSGGSDPLYVIDGFPITGGIGAINPDEIEDISVLKDAASTSLYGSRAANGVVLITTKKGVPGETHVSFNTSTGIQQVPQRGRIDMMDAVEFTQFKKEY